MEEQIINQLFGIKCLLALAIYLQFFAGDLTEIVSKFFNRKS